MAPLYLVAVPDPSVAASALGALGWFASHPQYGPGFHQALAQNGAVQVSTPDDVTTGVAQGRFKAGITITNSAYTARDAGSPVAVTWPQPGAIAIYGPVALARTSHSDAAARQFIGTSGSYPTLSGVKGPEAPRTRRWSSPTGRRSRRSAPRCSPGTSELFG